METIELIPENWTFAIGRQNTVRKGFKWADRVLPGEHIKFACTDGRRQVAIVRRVTKTDFSNLSDDECNANHAYLGRPELLAALKRAYGEFDDYEPITLIEFEPVS